MKIYLFFPPTLFDKEPILDEIVAELGEWTTVREVAKYFDVHTNTIYNLINEDVIIVRRVNGRAIRIYTKSLVCMLED